MKLLQKIWNYQPDPDRWKSVPMRAARGLCIFLVLMLCFTMISRAADSLTVPVVSVQKPKTMSLIHTVTADGNLKPVEKLPVTAVSGALVKELPVSAGDTVQEGELLFSFDTQELEYQVREQELAVRRAQAQLLAQQDSELADARKDQLSTGRAQEDYAAVEEQTQLDVEAAGDAVRVARRALSDFDGDTDDEEYDRDLYALRADLRNKERAYEQAVLAREEALVKAQRAIEDAQEEPSPSAQTDLLRIDCQLEQLKLDQLRQYLATAGAVYAPADGVVESVRVSVGGRTTEEAALFLTGTGGLKFTAQVTEKQYKRLAQGASASLELYGSSSAITGLRVSAVQFVPETSAYTVEVEVPAGTAVPGTGGTLRVSQKSASGLCVPLSALYSDGTQQYVLSVWETATAMGTEWTVTRVNVSVSDSNESYATITGLSGDAQIVTTADRTLKDGDRVRIREQAS